MDLTLENALDSVWIVLFVLKVKSVKILSAIPPDFCLKFNHCNSTHFSRFSSDILHCSKGRGSLNVFLVFERNLKLSTENIIISTPMKNLKFETQTNKTFRNFELQEFSNP